MSANWLLSKKTELVANRLDKLIRDRSWIGLTAILLAFVVCFIAIVLFIAQSLGKPVSPTADDLNRQLKELDHIKDSLARLASFIDAQATKLRQEQDLITTLSKERSELEPIVESQRRVIEGAIALLEKRAQREKWTSLWLGIVLGIFTSFTASVIFEILRRWTKEGTP